MSNQLVDISHPFLNEQYLRSAMLSDFLDCEVDDVNEYKHDNRNNEYIQKNQKNYGHTKRIKP